MEAEKNLKVNAIAPVNAEKTSDEDPTLLKVSSTEAAQVMLLSTYAKEEQRVLRKIDMVIMPLVYSLFSQIAISAIQLTQQDVCNIFLSIPGQDISLLCCGLQHASRHAPGRARLLLALNPLLFGSIFLRVSHDVSFGSISGRTCRGCLNSVLGYRMYVHRCGAELCWLRRCKICLRNCRGRSFTSVCSYYFVLV